MNNFTKGILLGLNEPGWKKFIKIPKSEIAVYVELMKMFNLPVPKSTLKKFRASQVKNYKNKSKTSYSYILTFQVLQDLKDNNTIAELLNDWGLSNSDKIKAGGVLTGLLKYYAELYDKHVKIQGADVIPIQDVFNFFKNPKVQSKGFEKVLSLSLGKLGGGVGLFVTPNMISLPKPFEIPTTGMFATSQVQPQTKLGKEMVFNDSDALQMEQELEVEKQLQKDFEYEQKLREQTNNKKPSWKKKVTKQVIKKGVPLGILGAVLKTGIDTFGGFAPFFLAYMALDTFDKTKKRGKK